MTHFICKRAIAALDKGTQDVGSKASFRPSLVWKITTRRCCRVTVVLRAIK